MTTNSPAETPFDPQARYVHPQTGLEYEDFGSYLAGEECNSPRNQNLKHLRKKGYVQHALKAYWEAYDSVPRVFDIAQSLAARRSTGTYEAFRPATHLERHEVGRKAGQATGCWGPADGSATTYDADAVRAWSRALNAAAVKPSIYTGILRGKPESFGIVTVDPAI